MFNQPKNIFGEPKEMFTGQTLPKPAVHYGRLGVNFTNVL